MLTAAALVQADDVITRVEKRIAMVTHLPEDNGEGLQILHYEAGQARCHRSALLGKAEQRMWLQSCCGCLTLSLPGTQSSTQLCTYPALPASLTAHLVSRGLQDLAPSE